MAERVARFKPGKNVPGFAVTAVLAGRFVKIVAPKTTNGDYSIGHCTAGTDIPFGVSEQDSAAATEPATSVERRVNVVRRGAVASVKSGADITVTTAAVAVKSDANGQAIPQAGTGTIMGYALHSAVFANGDYVEVDLV